jgi:hypothetical protein
MFGYPSSTTTYKMLPADFALHWRHPLIVIYPAGFPSAELQSRLQPPTEIRKPITRAGHKTEQSTRPLSSPFIHPFFIPASVQVSPQSRSIHPYTNSTCTPHQRHWDPKRLPACPSSSQLPPRSPAPPRRPSPIPAPAPPRVAHRAPRGQEMKPAARISPAARSSVQEGRPK